MKCIPFATATLLLAALATFAEQPANKPLVSGLNNPTSVAVLKGKTYVAVAGEFGKDGDGAIMVIEGDKAKTFVGNLDDPRGLTTFQQFLFVADKKRLWRVDGKGKAEAFVADNAFPTPPTNLCDVAVDVEQGQGQQAGTVYVCDCGDSAGKGWAVFKIAAPKKQVTVVADAKRFPKMQRPGAIVMDGKHHLLIMDSSTGTLYRIAVATGAAEKVADGLGSGDGMTWDLYGRLFISDSKGGKVHVIGRPGQNPVLLGQGFKGPGDLCVDANSKNILVADTKAGTISSLPAQVPGAEVDDSPMPIESVVAFPDLKWTGFNPGGAGGGKNPQHRPIILTHAGDGTNRVFVAMQQGVIHVFPNDPKATQTKFFLDLQKKVLFNPGQNEEGFLGLAFHPKYKTNGEFFAFYTITRGKGQKNTNVVSRFRVSKDDPNKADPTFEEELLRFEHRSWNHDGGTICFGPDGYLYVATGDGGLADDPDKNGQNLNTLLAKVLRIDVDRKENGKNYAIPGDNPFVGRKDAKPEVWAYGIRNLWRMAFDRKTGVLWAGEVGQNQYEEINIIVKGGNYGWSIREAFHPFSAKGVGVRPDLIDPIWEFHHSVGLCIIGGYVYRGSRVPELDGAYIYCDFQNGKMWALRYDDKAKRVTANRPLRTPTALTVMSFGEDEVGEVYTLAATANGKGIYHFQRTK